MFRKETKLYGVALCVIIGALAWSMGKFLPFGSLIGGPVFAILLGMLLAGVKRPATFEPGIIFAGKKILQYSIILIGFGLNIGGVVATGGNSIIIILSIIVTSLIMAYLCGKFLNVSSNVSTLIGVGTAICGGSAIAATASIIEADDKEVAHSISTIFLFNIIAILIFPPLGMLLNMSDLAFGIWAGTAINDTSSVVAAGYTFSTIAGDYATIVKLTRSLMIIPIAMGLAFWRTRQLAANSDTEKLNLVKVFPWFIIGFLLTAIINSLNLLPTEITAELNGLGRFCIMVAMAGIGLNTNLKSLIKNGKRPILLGLICWISVVIVSLILLYVTHIL